MIGDCADPVVPTDSEYQGREDVVAAHTEDPQSVKVAGGSLRGGMDHLVAARALPAAGGDSNALAYFNFDAGGEALLTLKELGNDWESVNWRVSFGAPVPAEDKAAADADLPGQLDNGIARAGARSTSRREVHRVPGGAGGGDQVAPGRSRDRDRALSGS